MASSLSVITTTREHHMDRLDAARALLGVSPASQSSEPSSNNGKTSRLSAASVSFASPITVASSAVLVSSQPTAQKSQETRFALTSSPSRGSPRAQQTATNSNNRSVSFQQPPTAQPQQQQQPTQRFELAPPAVVVSTGLYALAALASSEQASWEPRGAPLQLSAASGGPSLVVSASTTASSSSDDDSEAMPPPPPRAGGRRRSVSNPEGMEKWAPPNRRHFVLPASILEEELAEANAAMEAHQRHKQKLGPINEDEETQQQTASSAPISGLMSEEEQANLSPEELLKRARSRLLEDLSEGSINGEKGVLTLPHSLSKYKEVYNKNGRIGIYTPAERAAIIARFNSKRARRVWNKKIRYNCRKNLADRRMRVKGRFVKRSTEQQAKTDAAPPSAPAVGAPESAAAGEDQDMPDVTDPEAGFCPTEEQPYRRTRRHTIT
ncbi:CCT motif [Seminavis robusta]|uniref:CCT motif n=1 Tax=Seminavis robusta TaxID=568900 RepID=A0A9N8E2E0_9STRA|nr:CCT motif [Seminavis robusta]|eukprot:Sro580_g170140.1 CCT motif (438) ;mRNA; f:25273-26676